MLEVRTRTLRGPFPGSAPRECLLVPRGAVTFAERSARRVRFMSVRLGSARTWRVVLGALVVASFAAAVPLTVLSGQIFNALVAAAIGVPCAAVGWLVTRRQPGNPIGWLFLVTGVFMF